MKIQALKNLFAAAALMALLATAHATPGAVNSEGCHNSSKIGYHCHAGRASGGGNADGSRADRDRRLKRECKGQSNAGACTGYTR